jgi:hypothetical protein
VVDQRQWAAKGSLESSLAATPVGNSSPRVGEKKEGSTRNLTTATNGGGETQFGQAARSNCGGGTCFNDMVFQVERQRQGTKWRWGTMGVPTTPFIGPRREEIGREVKGNNGWQWSSIKA